MTTNLENDLATAMHEYTAEDTLSDRLQLRLAGAPRRARRRRTLARGTAALSVVAVGLAATAVARGTDGRDRPSAIAEDPPAATADPTSYPDAILDPAQDQAVGMTSLEVVSRLMAAKRGQAVVLPAALASSHLAGVALTSDSQQEQSGLFGLDSGALDPGAAMKLTAPVTTEEPTTLAVSPDRHLVYERVTVTATEGESSGDSDVEMVLVLTAAGWRVDSIAGDVDNGAAGLPPQGQPPAGVDTTSTAALIALADRAAASYPGSTGRTFSPTVVITGFQGAVVDVPDVGNQQPDGRPGVLRLYVNSASGLASAAWRGW